MLVQRLSDKYAPRKLGEVVDNHDKIAVFHRWLSEFDREKSERISLLSGPSGCGKTLLTRLVPDLLSYMSVVVDGVEVKARSASTDVKRIDGPKTRTEDIMEMITNRTLKMGKQQKACLIIENIEASDQSMIGKMIEHTKIPLIGTCGCGYEPKLKSLKASSKCASIELARPQGANVAKFLLKICKKEKIERSLGELKEITSQNDGDVRRCLNELEFTKGYERPCHDRDSPKLMTSFEATKMMFKTNMSIVELQSCANSADLVDLFVHENYHANARTLEQACRVADDLSHSDCCARSIPAEMNVCLSALLPARRCQSDRPVVKAFPALLGKSSTQRKKGKLSTGIRNALSASRKLDSGGSVVREILPQLRQMVIEILTRATAMKDRTVVKHTVSEVITRMKSLGLTRLEMMDAFELETSSRPKDTYAQLSSSIKATLTRTWK